MDNINKYFKKCLQGRSIINESGIDKLTLHEKRIIKHTLISKRMGYETPTIMPISERISLDFIGWLNDYNDVLIIKFNHKHLYK